MTAKYRAEIERLKAELSTKDSLVIRLKAENARLEALVDKCTGWLSKLVADEPDPTPDWYDTTDKGMK